MSGEPNVRRSRRGQRAPGGRARTPVTVRMAVPARDALDEMAAAKGLDRSELVRRYCGDGLARDGWRPAG